MKNLLGFNVVLAVAKALGINRPGPEYLTSFEIVPHVLQLQRRNYPLEGMVVGIRTIGVETVQFVVNTPGGRTDIEISDKMLVVFFTPRNSRESQPTLEINLVTRELIGSGFTNLDFEEKMHHFAILDLLFWEVEPVANAFRGSSQLARALRRNLEFYWRRLLPGSLAKSIWRFYTEPGNGDLKIKGNRKLIRETMYRAVLATRKGIKQEGLILAYSLYAVVQMTVGGDLDEEFLGQSASAVRIPERLVFEAEESLMYMVVPYITKRYSGYPLTLTLQSILSSLCPRVPPPKDERYYIGFLKKLVADGHLPGINAEIEESTFEVPISRN